MVIIFVAWLLGMAVVSEGAVQDNCTVSARIEYLEQHTKVNINGIWFLRLFYVKYLIFLLSSF